MSIANLFKGRLNRLNYFISAVLYYLVAYFANLALSSLIKPFGPGILQNFSSGHLWSGSFIWLFISALLVIIILSLILCSLVIRRLHDINVSGWWILLILVPLANIIGPLFLFFKKGTEGSNRYGTPNISGVSLRSILGA